MCLRHLRNLYFLLPLLIQRPIYHQKLLDNQHEVHTLHHGERNR